MRKFTGKFPSAENGKSLPQKMRGFLRGIPPPKNPQFMSRFVRRTNLEIQARKIPRTPRGKIPSSRAHESPKTQKFSREKNFHVPLESWWIIETRIVRISVISGNFHNFHNFHNQGLRNIRFSRIVRVSVISIINSARYSRFPDYRPIRSRPLVVVFQSLIHYCREIRLRKSFISKGLFLLQC